MCWIMGRVSEAILLVFLRDFKAHHLYITICMLFIGL